MSHTSKFQLPGYQGDVVVIHNGDWSGDAKVIFQEAVFGIGDKQEKPVKEVEIPGRLLIALALPVAKEFLITETISAFEQINVSKP
jgi:hypothetical protein